jgi:hypothetical protein
MKRYFFILLFIPMIVNSQVKKQQNLPDFEYKWLHFGFTVGTNIMNFGITKADNFYSETDFNQVYAIENQSIPGFILGPVSNIHMGEYFDFRFLVNLSFGQRNLTYLRVEDITKPNPKLTYHTMKLASTYLEFPLLVKYKAVRLNNMKPYIVGGINPKIDLAAQKKIKDEDMPKIRLNRLDLAWELGFGIDLYLPYFKLSPEIKYSRGLNDMVVRDNTQYTGAIKKLNSNIWTLSFHFEGSL